MNFANGAIASWLVIAAVPAVATAQSRDPLASFDAYVTSAMKDWKVPGVAIGIVKNDSIIYAKGFGVRTIGRPEKVDERTLFAIASEPASALAV